MPEELFPFRYRDELTGKWVRARYLPSATRSPRRVRNGRLLGRRRFGAGTLGEQAANAAFGILAWSGAIADRRSRA